uniref:Uncharacterized protein n=1 Tax=Neobodo designis TaxID=312471 RepID=A0A7S1MIZ2_NEODS|mmetsp:Transcript_41094/g.126878  ORF Transcript_41094/g.126878 Transcript_41094/m.126878 type:complete len:199 (+) Transcript_41094:39-635(+)|eukprot:CAMPEP_0174856584 /NCGR_PEP_ID=MMETSP1114-20130205/36114_1 /TAXON_ID=312471 /ORGANISM="Neobodo designis, Strain CCAP 1951/1" /LENGTH=198 /DNA_ID=CAMNT_0016091387 /DNA_START=33 /DNA_END=629 /DNA_ORIENTATION=-
MSSLDNEASEVALAASCRDINARAMRPLRRARMVHARSTTSPSGIDRVDVSPGDVAPLQEAGSASSYASCDEGHNPSVGAAPAIPLKQSVIFDESAMRLRLALEEIVRSEMMHRDALTGALLDRQRNVLRSANQTPSSATKPLVPRLRIEVVTSFRREAHEQAVKEHYDAKCFNDAPAQVSDSESHSGAACRMACVVM